jgi:hypothetical protein
VNRLDQFAETNAAKIRHAAELLPHRGLNQSGRSDRSAIAAHRGTGLIG